MYWYFDLVNCGRNVKMRLKRAINLFVTGNMNVRMYPILFAMYPLPIVIPIPSNQLPVEQKYECAKGFIYSYFISMKPIILEVTT